MTIDGVDRIDTNSSSTKFQKLNQPSSEYLSKGEINLDVFEIAQLQNNDTSLNTGVIEFIMKEYQDE